MSQNLVANPIPIHFSWGSHKCPQKLEIKPFGWIKSEKLILVPLLSKEPNSWYSLRISGKRLSHSIFHDSRSFFKHCKLILFIAYKARSVFMAHLGKKNETFDTILGLVLNMFLTFDQPKGWIFNFRGHLLNPHENWCGIGVYCSILKRCQNFHFVDLNGY